MDIVNDIFAKIEAIFKIVFDFIKSFMPEKEDAEAEVEA